MREEKRLRFSGDALRPSCVVGLPNACMTSDMSLVVGSNGTGQCRGGIKTDMAPTKYRIRENFDAIVEECVSINATQKLYIFQFILRPFK